MKKMEEVGKKGNYCRSGRGYITGLIDGLSRLGGGGYHKTGRPRRGISQDWEAEEGDITRLGGGGYHKTGRPRRGISQDWEAKEGDITRLGGQGGGYHKTGRPRRGISHDWEAEEGDITCTLCRGS